MKENYSIQERSIAIFKGHKQFMNNHDEDCTPEWSPEWNFFYFFGFKDMVGGYAILDLNSGEVTIALPRHDEVSQVFHGGLTTEDNPEKFGVDNFIYEDEIEKQVRGINPQQIFVLYGKIRDEMAHCA